MTPDEYVASLPEDRKEPVQAIRTAVNKNLPKGFKEVISYGTISYVVPHEKYPEGYHCNPSQPLPFVSIASQKNFIALYHMGMYGMPELLKWFQAEFPKHSKKKLDMGKSCVRFKKPEDIPFELIGQLMKKVTVDDWVSFYTSVIKR